jgi:hypothetical protein
MWDRQFGLQLAFSRRSGVAWTQSVCDRPGKTGAESDKA